MRKTRLVILPGVRSITQIGCLLLFLACPTIAFKGQEKRDIEPLCRIHELKYWWLPFDTGEGENSTTLQKWTGYQCQQDDMGIMTGQDNVTGSIHYSCDERIVSHGIVIHGQDANYNFKTNFGRNQRWAIRSFPGSLPTDRTSRKNSISLRHTIERNEITPTTYKTERVSRNSLERRAHFKDQRTATDRQSSFSFEQRGAVSRIIRMVQNRLQRYSLLSFERKYDSGKYPFNNFIRSHMSIRMYDKEEPNDQRRASSGRREAILERAFSQQEIHQRTERTEKRRLASLAPESKFRESNKRQQNISRRQCLSAFIANKENAHQSKCSVYSKRTDLKERSRMDRRLQRAVSIGNDRSVRAVASREVSLDRTMAEPNNRRDIRIHESEKVNTLERRNIRVRLGQREMTQRLTTAIIQPGEQFRINFEEPSRINRRIERGLIIEKAQIMSIRSRSKRSTETRVFSFDRRLVEPNPRQDIGIREDESTRRMKAEILRDSTNRIRENVSPQQNRLRQMNLQTRLGLRESTQRSLFVRSSLTKQLEERSRIDRRVEGGEPIEKNILSNRRSERSVEYRDQAYDSKAESRIVQNVYIRQDTERRSSSPRIERRETNQRSSFTNIQPKAFNERSRLDRRVERTVLLDKQQRSSDRSLSRADSRIPSLDRMPDSRIVRDTEVREKDSRRISSEMLRETRNNIREDVYNRQNTMQRALPIRLERRETTRRSAFAIIQPKAFEERSTIDRRVERAVFYDKERSSSDRRSVPFVGSRILASDRRTDSRTVRAIGINENENTQRIRSQTLRESRNNIRENVQQDMARRTLPTRLSRRETIHRSSFAIILPEGERSRLDRRVERAELHGKEQRFSDRRSVSPSDSRIPALDRMTGSRIVRDIEIHEKDNNRRIRSEMLRESRNKIHEDVKVRLNMVRRSLPERLERRETLLINKEQRSSGRITASPTESRFLTSNRIADSSAVRNARVNENTRRVRSEMLRESRDDNRQNTERRTMPVRLERRETIQRFDERIRMDRRVERAVLLDREKRSIGRSVPSIEYSQVFDSDRRMKESRKALNTERNEIDNIRRIRSEMFRESKDNNRENINIRQNTLGRDSPARTERKESTQRSAVNNILSKGFDEKSRLNRKADRAVLYDREQRFSDRRSLSLSNSRITSLDRMAESRIVLDTEIREKDNSRRIRSARNTIRSDVNIRLNTVRRSLPTRLERGETLLFDKEQRSSDRRSVSRILSFNRMPDSRAVRDDGINEKANTRRIPSELLRESRINIRQNTVRRTLSERNERRETIQRSALGITQLEHFDEKSRMNRRVEVRNLEKEQRSSDRRLVFPADSRKLPFERMAESEALRDAGINENDHTGRFVNERSRMDRRVKRDVLLNKEQRSSDRRKVSPTESLTPAFNRMADSRNVRDTEINENYNTRRIPSEILRESRRNIRLNTVRRTLPVRLERRETAQRSAFAIIQRKDMKERTLERRVERSESIEKLHNRRSERVESRVLAVARMTDSRIVRDTGINENAQTRRIRSEMLRESTNNIREYMRQITLRRSTPVGVEHKEISRRSAFDITQPKDFDERSRIDRVVLLDKEQRSSRILAFGRMAESRTVHNTGIDGIGKTHRIRSEMLRESRNSNRENVYNRQNTVRRNSPSRLERRETTQRSTFTNIQPKALDRRVERAVLLDKQQRSLDRSVSRVDSRIPSLDRKADSRIVRDTEVREKDSSRRIRSEMLRESRNSNRDNIYERQMFFSFSRRMTESNLRRDIRTHEKDISRGESFPRRLRTETFGQGYRESRTLRVRDQENFASQPFSSERSVVSPKQSSATVNRVSKSEHHGTFFVKPRNHNEPEVSNAQKSVQIFLSWISKMIFTIEKAVTGNEVEENILTHPNDSGVSRINKYLPGFTNERRNSKVLLDSEINNNKGHLMQDLVLGSAIAGYFISSIHLKMRDYRNFICIF